MNKKQIEIAEKMRIEYEMKQPSLEKIVSDKYFELMKNEAIKVEKYEDKLKQIDEIATEMLMGHTGWRMSEMAQLIKELCKNE